MNMTNTKPSALVVDISHRIRAAQEDGYRQGYAVGRTDGRSEIRRRARLQLVGVLFAGVVIGCELMLFVAASGVVR